jgi:hypothetical protein
VNIRDLNKEKAFGPKVHTPVRLEAFLEGVVAVDCFAPGQIGPEETLLFRRRRPRRRQPCRQRR